MAPNGVKDVAAYIHFQNILERWCQTYKGKHERKKQISA